MIISLILFGTRIRCDVFIAYLTVVVTVFLLPVTAKEGYSSYNTTMALIYTLIGIPFLMLFGMIIAFIASLKSRITKLS